MLTQQTHSMKQPHSIKQSTHSMCWWGNVMFSKHDNSIENLIEVFAYAFPRMLETILHHILALIVNYGM